MIWAIRRKSLLRDSRELFLRDSQKPLLRNIKEFVQHPKEIELIRVVGDSPKTYRANIVFHIIKNEPPPYYRAVGETSKTYRANIGFISPKQNANNPTLLEIEHRQRELRKNVFLRIAQIIPYAKSYRSRWSLNIVILFHLYVLRLAKFRQKAFREGFMPSVYGKTVVDRCPYMSCKKTRLRAFCLSKFGRDYCHGVTVTAHFLYSFLLQGYGVVVNTRVLPITFRLTWPIEGNRLLACSSLVFCLVFCFPLRDSVTTHLHRTHRPVTNLAPNVGGERGISRVLSIIWMGKSEKPPTFSGETDLEGNADDPEAWVVGDSFWRYEISVCAICFWWIANNPTYFRWPENAVILFHLYVLHLAKLQTKSVSWGIWAVWIWENSCRSLSVYEL